MNHIRNSHLRSDQEEDILNDAAEVQVKRRPIHKCSECGETFIKLPTLNLHMKENHPYEGDNNDDKLQEQVQQMDNQMKEIKKEQDGQDNFEVSEKDSGEIIIDDTVDMKESKSKKITKQEFPGKIPVATVAERTCIICKRTFDKIIQMKLHLVRHTRIFKNLKVEGKIIRSEDITSATCL